MMFSNFSRSRIRIFYTVSISLLLLFALNSIATGVMDARRTRAGILLREGPGNFYPMIMMLAEETDVVPFDSVSGWLHINLKPEISGWISSNALITKSSSSINQPMQFTKSTTYKTSSVSRAAIGMMIKGLAVRIGVDQANIISYETMPGLDQGSVVEFRSGFSALSEMAPVSAFQKGQAMLPQYLSISPALVSRQIDEWGGRRPGVEAYTMQILLWIADRAGITGMDPHILIGIGGSNAYSFPGGWIVIGGEIFEQIRDEAELAGVIGHELAHCVHQHGEKALTKDSWRIGVADAFSELDAMTDSGDEMAELEQMATDAVLMVQRKHGIDNEMEADKTATSWLAVSGYDPDGLLRVLKRMREKFGDRLTGHGSISLAWLNSKDELDTRIMKLEKQAKKLRKKAKKAKRFEDRFRLQVGR